MSARTDTRRRPTRSRGVSLIELMVGLVVGLLVSLAAANSAMKFTASQRQGVGTGSGFSNATTALVAIKNDVANSGLGFFGDSSYLCNRLNLGSGATAFADGEAFAPLQINRTGSNDQLDVVYGSEVAAGASVKLASTSDGTAGSLKTLLPVTAGQAVLVAPVSSGDPCLVRTVTATTVPTAEVKQQLTFGAAGAHNQADFATMPSYGENGRVTLLGALQWNRYALDGTSLVLTRVVGGTSAVLLRNVIAFRVEVGASSAAAGSSTLESWEPPAGTFSSISSANIARVRAVRIGIVVRSAQPEKPNDTTGVCEASTAKPTLFDEVAEPDVADWRCYRYRTTIVVVPMRNIIYGLRSS